ncbi:hypothetical protein [Grimontia hollisae]|uniref:hypothetical protein n=1 Tax=Grimontia hollisae TaxID=673 RepID=UPI00165DE88E|nr:hypothetical protein [Grimontia hollisae]
MKNVQKMKGEAKDFVANLFSNGQTPSERFGMTWDKLKELEAQVPELTCSAVGNCQKRA